MTSDDLMARICETMRTRFPKCTVYDGGVMHCIDGRGWVASVHVVGASGRKVTEHTAWSAVKGHAARNLAVALCVSIAEESDATT
jgi:hypothetical protein